MCCAGPSRAMDGAWGATRDGSSESAATHRYLRRGLSTPHQTDFSPTARATTNWGRSGPLGDSPDHCGCIADAASARNFCTMRTALVVNAGTSVKL